MGLTGARRGLVAVKGHDEAVHAEVVAGLWPSRSLAERFAVTLGGAQALDTRATTSLAGPRGVVGTKSGRMSCIPLRTGDRLLGLIYLGGCKSGPGPAELDLEILEALAEHAAILLASLRLQRRVRGFLRRLRRGTAVVGVRGPRPLCFLDPPAGGRRDEGKETERRPIAV
jgi:hypothetical protein